VLKIYVDESGDLGTGGRYFVIGAFCTEDGKRVRNIIKKHCAKYGLDELKNFGMLFLHREEIAHKFRKIDDHKMGYVCVDKTKIQSSHLRANQNLLFNYAFSYLAKELIKSEKQDVRFIVDNRNQKVGSRNSLGEYIRIKAYTEWGFTNDIQTEYLDSKADRLIQAADFVSGNCYQMYHNNRPHIYNILKPEISIKFPNTQFGQ
jgi:hypothetical protein